MEGLKVESLCHITGGQKKFGDERPFTREGNYLVFHLAHLCFFLRDIYVEFDDFEKIIKNSSMLCI